MWGSGPNGPWSRCPIAKPESRLDVNLGGLINRVVVIWAPGLLIHPDEPGERPAQSLMAGH